MIKFVFDRYILIRNVYIAGTWYQLNDMKFEKFELGPVGFLFVVNSEKSKTA